MTPWLSYVQLFILDDTSNYKINKNTTITTTTPMAKLKSCSISLFILMFVDPHDTITNDHGHDCKCYQPHFNYNLLCFFHH